VKKIRIHDSPIGSGLTHIGWSGRGWGDGGPVGAGPLNSRAPAWDTYGQEVGINIVRMGFSIRHFLPDLEETRQALADRIRRGLENKDVSWAKSEGTSYSYSIQRCRDLGWKILICINPSYKSVWSPPRIVQSSESLRVWKEFCYQLAKSIEDIWPSESQYFEITNEPDLGYFDGESFLPDYQGPSGGIAPFPYSLLLKNAYEGIKKAVPQAKVIAPGLASWNRFWLEEILRESQAYLDGLSYHNVGGDLKDDKILEEAEGLLSQSAPQAKGFLFNSEWAWWPNHDVNDHETALRIAQIIHLQTIGNAFASLYLGPAQPMDYKKGLGVLRYDPDDPNSVEKTKAFYVFRMMARGVLGGKRLALVNPHQKLKILALLNDQKELVMTVINPNKKRLKNISIDIDEVSAVQKEFFLKIHKFDYNHLDSCEKSDWRILSRFQVEPESIIQFVISSSD